METTEKIVEAYVRYLKGWATIPNIKCHGQLEIDLLAINMKTGERYHIESSVSISDVFSKLKAKEFSKEKYKDKIGKPGQRRTLGFFLEKKFMPDNVIETLKAYGFVNGNYKRVIVTWGVEEGVEELAENDKIKIWYFPKILNEISDALKNDKRYFSDDTFRTIHLISKAKKEIEKVNRKNSYRSAKETKPLKDIKPPKEVKHTKISAIRELFKSKKTVSINELMDISGFDEGNVKTAMSILRNPARNKLHGAIPTIFDKVNRTFTVIEDSEFEEMTDISKR